MTPKLLIAALTAVLVCFSSGALQAETLWTPYVGLSGIHDDNILLTGTDPDDDYIYALEPGVKFNYDQQLTKLSADGRILVRRYQDNSDLDDEIYRFDLGGNTNFTERSSLSGNYEFIKDTTLDSELEETGRIFGREDRFSQSAMLTPSFGLTERTSIGLSGLYRNVTYDSDTKVDYSVWDIGLPIRWRLGTQVDTLYITPGFTNRDSDINSSDSFNLRIGWDHKTTERLNVKFLIGARFSEFENKNSGDTEENSGALGGLKFEYSFETGKLTIDLTHDLKNTANGQQVNVSQAIVRLIWNFTERMGLDLRGRYYYTKTEGEINDNATEYIQVGPELNYHLTKNHIVYIAYQYSQDDQKDVEDEPRAERNRIWAGIRLNFPIN